MKIDEGNDKVNILNKNKSGEIKQDKKEEKTEVKNNDKIKNKDKI